MNEIIEQCLESTGIYKDKIKSFEEVDTTKAIMEDGETAFIYTLFKCELLDGSVLYYMQSQSKVAVMCTKLTKSLVSEYFPDYTY